MPNKMCPLTKFLSMTTQESVGKPACVGSSFYLFFVLLSTATDLLLRTQKLSGFLVAAILLVLSSLAFKSDVFSRQKPLLSPAMGAAFTISLFGSLLESFVNPLTVPNPFIGLVLLLILNLGFAVLLGSLVSFVRGQARGILGGTDTLLNDRGYFVMDGKEYGYVYSEFLYMVSAFKGFPLILKRAASWTTFS